jgi:CxxC-x17-CxxC domain-containing protein
MKNFKPNNFRSNSFGRSGGDNRRPEGRYNTGRPAREERRGDGPELFKTTCTTCGKPCEVPFRPDGIKPVLCKDCFAQKDSSGSDQIKRYPEKSFKPVRDYESAPAARPTAQNNADFKLIIKQIGEVEEKVNHILKLLTVTKEPVATQPTASDETIETAKVPTKVRKPKKVAVKKVAAKKKKTK